MGPLHPLYRGGNAVSTATPSCAVVRAYSSLGWLTRGFSLAVVALAMEPFAVRGIQISPRHERCPKGFLILLLRFLFSRDGGFCTGHE